MKNTIARILFGIGVATIVFGVVGSVALVADGGYLFAVGVVASVVSGMLHIGFAEVINLLQQSVDTQQDVALLTDVGNTEGKGASVRVVENIEAELPKL